ncbi:hypothetical protein [Sphingomonas sp. G-3-2-10]|uniref:hypothetical protein n=1 Tax=Sphingomonas sp. G-3-2-10 TaxID=2728838 RepID=UPI00146C2583|nr:hypothetical protein [Sphingomonas sp. G-3-2-10]NML04727.1 hypothetical protein [Sphingomonas sp. G-3-2-10]
MIRPPDKHDDAALGYLTGFFGAGLLLISGGGFWFLIRYGQTVRYRGDYLSVGETLPILILLAVAGAALLRLATKLLPPR